MEKPQRILQHKQSFESSGVDWARATEASHHADEVQAVSVQGILSYGYA